MIEALNEERSDNRVVFILKDTDEAETISVNVPSLIVSGVAVSGVCVEVEVELLRVDAVSALLDPVKLYWLDFVAMLSDMLIAPEESVIAFPDAVVPENRLVAVPLRLPVRPTGASLFSVRPAVSMSRVGLMPVLFVDIELDPALPKP